MKKHLLFICMIGLSFVMFGQKANAITIYVDAFDIRFEDPYAQIGCNYYIEYKVIGTNPSCQSGWLGGQYVSSPGTWTFNPQVATGLLDQNPSGYFEIVVRVTKVCTGDVRYGYSNPVDLDIKYHLSPDGITVSPSF